MDKLTKNLSKIPLKQREQILSIVEHIAADDLAGLDVKKLKNTDNVFRVRSGKYRIIFTKNKSGQNIINVISRRTEKTYKSY